MSFDISTLEPQIRDILSAPGTDLQTISAKRVRKMLLESEPSLTEEVLKNYKAKLDAMIATVFQSVSAEAGMVESPEEPKRKRDNLRAKDEEEADDGEDDAPTPPPKKARKATKKELTDAELARQLSSEINGRTRRSGAGNGSAAKKGNRKTKKSADFIDTDDSGDDGDGAKKKKKSGTKTGRAKGGFAKEYLLSPSLAAVLGATQLSRPQVVKHLWDHIKGHELQNPRNKKEIMCDDGLRAVFGCDKIDMFRMNKVLGMHLHEVNE